jgi:hypothetical protein
MRSRKTRAEDLDIFIVKFDKLAAQAGNAISDPLRRLNSVVINSGFLNTLEYWRRLGNVPHARWRQISRQ